jgi:transposase
LQTSDALGAAAAQLGPDAQAAVVELNKQGGLSHGKVVRCLKSLFGISLSRGRSVHTVRRVASRCEPDYEAIRQAVSQSDWVVPDETGWRVGGLPARLHALVTLDATAYVIDPSRNGAAAESMLGLDYDGIMIHDGWSPHDQFVLGLPKSIKGWTLTMLREKLVEIGAKVVTHAKYVTLQLAEVPVPQPLFAQILGRIAHWCPACALG